MLSDRDYDLISGYLDDALTESERAEVESRLRTEAEFAAELTALRRTVELVKALPELTAPRDFRLTREQAKTAEMSWPSKRGAQMSWPSKRAPIAFRQAVIPLMSAAASVIMVVVGFFALVSGQPAQPAASDMASVAMLDESTGAGADLIPQTFNVEPALLPAGTPPAPIDPTSDSDMALPAAGGMGGAGDNPPPGMGGGGGGGDEDSSAEFSETLEPIFLTPVNGIPTDDIAPFTMMSEATPSPDFDGALRSMAPAPTSPEPTTEESESADTMMFESAPAATDAPASTQVAELTYDAAAADIVGEQTTLKAHSAWDGNGISPLAGMILLIAGLTLGMASWILWRAHR